MFIIVSFKFEFEIEVIFDYVNSIPFDYINSIPLVNFASSSKK